MKKRIRLEITEQAHQQLLEMQSDYEHLDLAVPTIQQIHNKLLDDALSGHKMRIDGENAWKLARMFPDASSLEEASKMMLRRLDKLATAVIELADDAFEKCRQNGVKIPRKVAAEYALAKRTHLSRELGRFQMGVDTEPEEERAARTETIELAIIENLTRLSNDPSIIRNTEQATLIAELLAQANQRRTKRLSAAKSGEAK